METMTQTIAVHTTVSVSSAEIAPDSATIAA
jgi:hypothetical protein